MLNRKPVSSTVSSHHNVTSQRKPNLSVVPDVKNGSHNTNEVEQSEQLFLGNEANRLTDKEWENYMNVIGTPREPSPNLIEDFKQYLENKA